MDLQPVNKILLCVSLWILSSNFPIHIQSSGSRQISFVNADASVHPSRATKLCCNSRAFLHRNFLTYEECDNLIVKAAKDKLQNSTVADIKTGKSIGNTVQSSKDMFIWKPQHETVSGIESKISPWLHPVENGEGIQVLHYEKGQRYSPQRDSFQDKTNQSLGSHMMVTLVMFLSDVERVNETVFPQTETKESQMETAEAYECGKTGYAVKAKKGDALLVFSHHPNGTIDPMSFHRGCPVIEGEIWLATKPIRAWRFDGELITAFDGQDCRDDEFIGCVELAAGGECERNASNMIGTAHSPGLCRKTCLGC